MCELYFFFVMFLRLPHSTRTNPLFPSTTLFLSRWGEIAIDDEYRSSVVLGAGSDWRIDRARLSLDLAYQRAKVEHMRPMVQLSGVTAVPDAPKASSNYGQDWNYTTLRDIFGILKFEYRLEDRSVGKGWFSKGSSRGLPVL